MLACSAFISYVGVFFFNFFRLNGRNAIIINKKLFFVKLLFLSCLLVPLVFFSSCNLNILIMLYLVHKYKKKFE